MAKLQRCAWAESHELYKEYHDTEWGVPLFDDQLLFEFLSLEGAQAGLSWLTILKKREHYRRLFDCFSIEKVAKYSDTHLNKILQDPGIVRNRLKVYSVRKNAQAVMAIQEKHGSLSNYLWDFVDGTPITNSWKTVDAIPATTPLSDSISKELKKLGCSFVGSTICYAFMQAVGMVNDHVTNCFRYEEIQKLPLK